MTTARKTSKVAMNSVRVRDTTLEKLSNLADELGKNSPSGLAAEILEAISDINPKNYYKAISAMQQTGEK